MQIEWIALCDFRSYAALSYSPSSTLNVVTGSNGQGKTNLLEALGLLLVGRSFRGAKALEIARWDAPRATVSGELKRTDATRSIRRTIGPREDGAWVVTGEGCAWARAIPFGWQDLAIITGGPHARRGFLDGFAGKLFPAHAATVARYRRVLERRNHLLQSGQPPMLALVGRRPQVVNLRQMLQEFVAFRREIVTRRTKYDLARAEERAHILEGLRKAVDALDLVIAIIRGAENPDAARDGLMRRLQLSEIQARAILDMRLQRLTQLERHKIVEEHEQTLALIADLKGILASEQRLMGIIRDELLALKEEFGDARRTEILAETTDLTIEDLLADDDMVVTITRSGYIKRTHVESYRSQRRGGKGVTGM